MEGKLKIALLKIIADYDAIIEQIHDPRLSPDRKLQLFTAKEALHQVLQHLMHAEYLENVDRQWRIKVIVTESAASHSCDQIKTDPGKTR